MKVFHCDHCDHLVFFESFWCVRCNHPLAFLPDLQVVGSLDASDGGWRSPISEAKDRTYRLCQNYSQHHICNWTIPSDDPNPYCQSCRLTRIIPNLSKPENKDAWFKLEVAKRRLIYSLKLLNLPMESREDLPECGLAFEFLADAPIAGAPEVLTGHNNGLITVNIAEADDSERERRRHQMHEPYRTLLGHFRHEIGHYYWDRLIKKTERLNRFREMFGDERDDYASALNRHYQAVSPSNWSDHFISEYATAHPWEDWAECWAHYMHMTDTLETAIDCGLSLRSKRDGEPALRPDPKVVAKKPSAFDVMIESWHAITYVLNNLNRSMGQRDGYPFVLSTPVIEKLRFVHEVVTSRC